ncbi:hypothetical protein B0I35DRAFT_484580 [Stachybotrys elegans]|uniref:Uncharacterized protein n=1 Tax=Stachybotrys elegans TaxID=80388 RepID=A0A8K0SD56_9HYPO|nr:hypothetical protein B0I35DRAFT_484580 [Stachybotrys elegans]
MSIPPGTFFPVYPTGYDSEGLIQLGQIITDSENPFERLAKPLPLEESFKLRYNTITKESKDGDMQTSDHSNDVLAAELQITKKLPFYNMSSTTTTHMMFGIMETQYIEVSEGPESQSYLDRTSNIPEIERLLRKHHLIGKSLYMITGLKIVKGTSRVVYDDRSASHRGLEFKSRFLQARALNRSIQNSTEEMTLSSPHVIAYSLRRLRVSWRSRKLVLDKTRIRSWFSAAKTDEPDVSETAKEK